MGEGSAALRAQTASCRVAEVDVRGSGLVLSITLLAAASVAIIWLVDISTGPEYGFAIFYLIPIGLASWWLGRGPAVFMALLATIAWVWAEVVARSGIAIGASLRSSRPSAVLYLLC